MRMDGFTVWVTGPDEAAVGVAARELTSRLVARHVPTELLDARTPGIGTLVGEGIACVAGALARHGVASVVALPAPTREVRDRARSALGRMIEVYVRPDTDPGGRYEAPDRPEVEVDARDVGSGAAADRTLTTLEILALLPRMVGRDYPEDEERAIIRRLKAFGYL